MDIAKCSCNREHVPNLEILGHSYSILRSFIIIDLTHSAFSRQGNNKPGREQNKQSRSALAGCTTSEWAYNRSSSTGKNNIMRQDELKSSHTPYTLFMSVPVLSTPSSSPPVMPISISNQICKVSRLE